MKSFLTEENAEFLETKLVDILDEFQLSDSKTLTIVKENEENSLILVTSKKNHTAVQGLSDLTRCVLILFWKYKFSKKYALFESE